MKLPELKNTEKYVGLYVFDFDDHVGVGFTAQEVAELLDSEKYRHCKVYKIYNAYPDGKVELKGVRPETFQLEMGMFFYCSDATTAAGEFSALINLAVTAAPPCRAKVHLAKYSEDKFVTAMIFPAEYNDDISAWLLDGEYKTAGPAEAGIEAAQRYYDDKPKILETHQLFAKPDYESRTGQELLTNLKQAVQR